MLIQFFTKSYTRLVIFIGILLLIILLILRLFIFHSPQPPTNINFHHLQPTQTSGVILQQFQAIKIAEKLPTLENPKLPNVSYFKVQMADLVNTASKYHVRTWYIILERNSVNAYCSDSQLQSISSPLYCFPGNIVFILNAYTGKFLSVTHTPTLSVLVKHLAYTKYLLGLADK